MSSAVASGGNGIAEKVLFAAISLVDINILPAVSLQKLCIVLFGS